MQVIHLNSFPIENPPKHPLDSICGSKDPDSITTDDEDQVNCLYCLHRVIRELRTERDTWRDSYHEANIAAIKGMGLKAKVRVVRERVVLEISRRVSTRFGLNLHSVQTMVDGAFDLLETTSE